MKTLNRTAIRRQMLSNLREAAQPTTQAPAADKRPRTVTLYG